MVESLYGNSEARIVLVGALGEESRERNEEESRGRIGGDRRIGGEWEDFSREAERGGRIGRRIMVRWGAPEGVGANWL